MEPREIYLFARIEKDHFFYRARRELVRDWLKKFFPNQDRKIQLIEVGTGTGILIKELSRDYEAFGCDLYFDPKISLSQDRMIKSDACYLPFPDNFADATVALDLIEHLKDDFKALLEFKRITKPGGYLFLNVPAFSLLFSDWDEAVGHQRRYQKKTLQALLAQAGLKIIFLHYVNSAPFIPMLIYRWLRKTFGIGKRSRLEDRMLPKPLNQILLWLFLAQGKSRWLNLPFGASLFAILQKPEVPVGN